MPALDAIRDFALKQLEPWGASLLMAVSPADVEGATLLQTKVAGTANADFARSADGTFEHFGSHSLAMSVM